MNWILQFPEDEMTKLTKFSIIPEKLYTAAPHSRLAQTLEHLIFSHTGNNKLDLYFKKGASFFVKCVFFYINYVLGGLEGGVCN